MRTPAEMYTPPPISLSCCLMLRTSFLSPFFSLPLSSVISMPLMALNLKISAFAALASLEVFVVAVFAANAVVGTYVNDMPAINMKTIIFFIVSVF